MIYEELSYKSSTGNRTIVKRHASPPLACVHVDHAANLSGGSFSAVSTSMFASKYSLVTRCYAKQYEIVLRCMSPCSVCTADFFQLKMLRIASQ